MIVQDLSASDFVSRSLNHVLLSDAVEKRLLEEAKAGDRDAVDQLIEFNQRLVVSMARRYHRAYGQQELELCDLVQAGNIGLYKAIQLWDARKKVKFSTYAFYWIRAYERRLSLHRSTTLSVSYGFSEKLGIIRRARSVLLRELGQEPNIEQIAAATGLASKEVELGLSAILKSVSMDKPLDTGSGKEGGAFGELLPDCDQNTEEAAIALVLLSHAQKTIAQMPESWQIVVRHRFGLDGAEVMTQAQIGKKLDMTRQNIDHIEKAALRRIRQEMLFPVVKEKTP
jgi:RNA polymerase primary sigma factor